MLQTVTPIKSSPKLIDSFGRKVSYLRLSVTDRCNLRCTYCMAEKMTFLPKAEVLTLEEMHFICKAFVELGVQKIRLTGGEPLVRKGIVELSQLLSNLDGLNELVMTTNGVLLPDTAQDLKNAGVKRLNISLDSLNADRFKSMSRVGELHEVLAGIEAARQVGFNNIKLNAVILAGQNDHEIVDLAQYAIDRGLDITFIEEMPLGAISSHQRNDTQTTSQSIREVLEDKFNLADDYNENKLTDGPSRYLNIADSSTKIGFISPISNNFCSTCNRVRLTAEGKLLLCLGNEHSLDLRAIVREHPSDIELLKQEIVNSMHLKPEKHHFDPTEISVERFMNMTGG